MLTTTPAEGDIVLLRPTRDPDNDGILTKPLQPDHTIHTHRGTLLHSSIIGRRVREVVATSKGINYRLHEPTLAEYVRLTPRLVTPVRLMSPPSRRRAPHRARPLTRSGRSTPATPT